MSKKKKIVIDMEAIYGLNGPGIVRDNKLREEVKQWFNDVLGERHPYNEKVPSIKVNDFINVFGSPLNFGLNDPKPEPIDTMSFLNGERKHILWGKHHYEQDEELVPIEGEYYWVQFREGHPWCIAEVVATSKNDRYFRLFMGDGAGVENYKTVYDWKKQPIEKPV